MADSKILPLVFVCEVVSCAVTLTGTDVLELLAGWWGWEAVVGCVGGDIGCKFVGGILELSAISAGDTVWADWVTGDTVWADWVGERTGEVLLWVPVLPTCCWVSIWRGVEANKGKLCVIVIPAMLPSRLSIGMGLLGRCCGVRGRKAL